MKRKNLFIPVYGWEMYFVENGHAYLHTYHNGEYVGAVEVKYIPAYNDRNNAVIGDFWYTQTPTVGMLPFIRIMD